MAFHLPTFISENATLLSAIFGGAGVKLLDNFLSKRGQSFTDATSIRNELRLEIETLRENLAEYRIDANTWRTKYWEEIEENIILKSTVESNKHDVTELRSRIKELEAIIPHISGSI